MSYPLTLTARWILPLSSTPLERGTITLDKGVITRVDPFGVMAPDRDFGNALLLPSFVNAHTHLDLTAMRGNTPPSPDFTNWLRSVIQHRRTTSFESTQEAIEEGIRESLNFGVSLVGDISGDGSSFDILAKSRLRAVCFREILGLTNERWQIAQRTLDDWLCQGPRGNITRGVSPHAPYSVHREAFSLNRWKVPIMIHLAESLAELELLEKQTGPFREFLESLGVWEPANLAALSEILQSLRGDQPALLAHANYLPLTSELPSNATIVYCPRTHAAFGHSKHAFREWLARGQRVAIGTDSLASNPDLDVLGELRFLHRCNPEISSRRLLNMGTLFGAQALGYGNQLGSLEAGKLADFVVYPLPNEDIRDPECVLLETTERPCHLCIRGEFVDLRI